MLNAEITCISQSNIKLMILFSKPYIDFMLTHQKVKGYNETQ